MKMVISSVFSIFMVASAAYGQGDTLQDVCYNSMRYNVAVQLAGSAFSDASREEYRSEAYDSGGWLGIDKSETDRMIVMASGSPHSNQFAYQYLSDPSFANAYRSGFINDCKSNPGNKSLKRD